MSNYDYDCWGGPDGRCGVHKVPYVYLDGVPGVTRVRRVVGDAGTESRNCAHHNPRCATHRVLHHRQRPELSG